MVACKFNLLILQVAISFSSRNGKACSMSGRDITRSTIMLCRLRGGGADGQISHGKKLVHEDSFSPYEISALKSLAAEPSFNQSVQNHSIWYDPEDPVQSAKYDLANGITESDLPRKPKNVNLLLSKLNAKSFYLLHLQKIQDVNFEDFCQWCNKNFQANAKLWVFYWIFFLVLILWQEVSKFGDFEGVETAVNKGAQVSL